MGAFFSGLWVKLAAIGAAIVAFVVFLGMVRKSGGDAERSKELEAQAETKRRMEDADARGPRTGADASDRMRKGDF